MYFFYLGEFELQARVINKPYDVFGTWYNDNYLLSGNLHLTGPLQSCSSIILNKVRINLKIIYTNIIFIADALEIMNIALYLMILVLCLTHDNLKFVVSEERNLVVLYVVSEKTNLFVLYVVSEERNLVVLY